MTRGSVINRGAERDKDNEVWWWRRTRGGWGWRPFSRKCFSLRFSKTGAFRTVRWSHLKVRLCLSSLCDLLLWPGHHGCDGHKPRSKQKGTFSSLTFLGVWSENRLGVFFPGQCSLSLWCCCCASHRKKDTCVYVSTRGKKGHFKEQFSLFSLSFPLWMLYFLQISHTHTHSWLLHLHHLFRCCCFPPPLPPPRLTPRAEPCVSGMRWPNAERQRDQSLPGTEH